MKLFKHLIAGVVGGFAAFLVLFACLIFLLALDYLNWKRDLEVRAFDSSLRNIKIDELEKDSLTLTEKFIKFSESEEKVDFVTLTEQETLTLVTYQLSRNLPAGMTIKNAYLSGNSGLWEFYFEPSYNSTSFPMVYISVKKDQIETAQVYIDQINFGQIDSEVIFGKKLIENINRSYLDALIDTNENDLGYRELVNIELTNNEVIIKGRID